MDEFPQDPQRKEVQAGPIPDSRGDDKVASEPKSEVKSQKHQRRKAEGGKKDDRAQNTREDRTEKGFDGKSPRGLHFSNAAPTNVPLPKSPDRIFTDMLPHGASTYLNLVSQQ